MYGDQDKFVSLGVSDRKHSLIVRSGDFCRIDCQTRSSGTCARSTLWGRQWGLTAPRRRHATWNIWLQDATPSWHGHIHFQRDTVLLDQRIHRL